MALRFIAQQNLQEFNRWTKTRRHRRWAFVFVDGAVRIGEGAMLGAGALLSPGKAIPPREIWVGRPAKFLRTQDEFGQALVLPDLVRAQQAIMAADHLVLLFPLWLGTMPALVKAFLEQVLRPGFAFQYQANGLPRRLLTGKSARVVVTMGMPALAYRWWYGAHGVRGLERNILAFVGFGPIRRTLIGGIAGLGPSGGRARCEEMRALGRRAL